MSPKSYRVQAEDSNGPCLSPEYIVTVEEATGFLIYPNNFILLANYFFSAVVPIVDVVQPNCNGDNGTIIVSASGGTGSYKYSVVVRFFFYLIFFYILFGQPDTIF